MTAVMGVSIIVIFVSGLLCVLRLVKGPTQSDRVALLDLLTSVGICALLLASVLSDNKLFVDLAFLLGVLTAISTMGLAYYLEREGEK